MKLVRRQADVGVRRKVLENSSSSAGPAGAARSSGWNETVGKLVGVKAGG
jgi:hypothetical protein